MSIPELQKTGDSHCKLGLFSQVSKMLQRKLTRSALGDTIPGTTASMIEMHVGIIAASLVLMRQLIQIVLFRLTGKQITQTGNSSKVTSSYMNVSARSGRPRATEKENEYRMKITRRLDVDVEMQNRSISTENILEPTQTPRRMA